MLRYFLGPIYIIKRLTPLTVIDPSSTFHDAYPLFEHLLIVIYYIYCSISRIREY